MLTDLLSALHGFHGGLFTVDGDNHFIKFRRNDTNIFMSNGEVNQLNEILETATKRLKIKKFCNDKKLAQDYYINIIQRSIIQAMKKSYDKEIIQFEKDLLTGGNERYFRNFIWGGVGGPMKKTTLGSFF